MNPLRGDAWKTVHLSYTGNDDIPYTRYYIDVRSLKSTSYLSGFTSVWYHNSYSINISTLYEAVGWIVVRDTCERATSVVSQSMSRSPDSRRFTVDDTGGVGVVIGRWALTME